MDTATGVLFACQALDGFLTSGGGAAGDVLAVSRQRVFARCTAVLRSPHVTVACSAALCSAMGWLTCAIDDTVDFAAKRQATVNVDRIMRTDAIPGKRRRVCKGL